MNILFVWLWNALRGHKVDCIEIVLTAIETTLLKSVQNSEKFEQLLLQLKKIIIGVWFISSWPKQYFDFFFVWHVFKFPCADLNNLLLRLTTAITIVYSLSLQNIFKKELNLPKNLALSWSSRYVIFTELKKYQIQRQFFSSHISANYFKWAKYF